MFKLALKYRRPAFPRDAGFTIIEALVAGIILALAGVAIGQAVTQSMTALDRARSTRRAAALLDRAMIRIDAVGPARVISEGPTRGRFDPPNERFRWQAQVQTMMDPDLYEVTVTVTWRAGGAGGAGGGQRSVNAATRLTDPPGSRNAGLTMNDL